MKSLDYDQSKRQFLLTFIYTPKSLSLRWEEKWKGTDSNSCETHVFGIKYSNIKGYIKYRDYFIVFNRSLVKTAEY